MGGRCRQRRAGSQNAPSLKMITPRSFSSLKVLFLSLVCPSHLPKAIICDSRHFVNCMGDISLDHRIEREHIMTKTTLTLATMTAVAFLTSITISTPSFAKMVSNSTAASLLTQCLVAKDSNTNTSAPAGWGACCSKSLGYCVECPPNRADKCHKYPIRYVPTRPKIITPAPGQLAPVESKYKSSTSKPWNKWQRIPQKNRLRLRQKLKSTSHLSNIWGVAQSDEIASEQNCLIMLMRATDNAWM